MIINDNLRDIVLESLIINESALHDMLVAYSVLPNWRVEYNKDIVKLNRIRDLITELGGSRLHTSTESWESLS